jgi:uncharacterized protein
VSWWQDWVNHAEPGDPFWAPLNFSAGRPAIPPTAMIAGWHGIFLPWQIKDYETIRAAQGRVTLTIGPWTHSAIEAWGESVRQALSLFRERLLGKPGSEQRAAVRLYVMGAAASVERWREYDGWPPEGFSPVAFYFWAGGALSVHEPPASAPSNYTYDPADPTPAVHGPRLNGERPTGDIAELEIRPDVLLFTGEPHGTNGFNPKPPFGTRIYRCPSTTRRHRADHRCSGACP